MMSRTSNGAPQNQRRHMRRLYDPEAKVYLHMSGQGTTQTEEWAWMGLPSQAAVLKERAETRGEAWPFQVIPVEGERNA